MGSGFRVHTQATHHTHTHTHTHTALSLLRHTNTQTHTRARTHTLLFRLSRDALARAVEEGRIPHLPVAPHGSGPASGREAARFRRVKARRSFGSRAGSLNGRPGDRLTGGSTNPGRFLGRLADRLPGRFTGRSGAGR